MIVHYLEDESGQGMVEYALIIVCVSLAAMFILYTMHRSIGNMYNSVISEYEKGL